jgi:hypothetical protein
VNHKIYSSKVEDLRSEKGTQVCEFKGVDHGLNTSILFEFFGRENGDSITIRGKITFEHTLSYWYQHFDYYDYFKVREAYNSVIVIDDSEMIKELNKKWNNSKESPPFDFVPIHFRLLFDDGPCFDVVAKTYKIEYDK